ncbi:hypothetical protein ACFL7E_08290 [Thermodesulfobacteriota bacterium]
MMPLEQSEKMKNNQTNKLYDLIDPANTQDAHDEIKYIISLVTDDYDDETFDIVLNDTVRLFGGEYPGYQPSKTKYHDLEHTNSVVLATARLMHGCFLEGETLKPRSIFLLLVAALFHDIGLIQTANDKEGTGAKHTVGHEDRSIEFMTDYLLSKGFSTQDTEDCSHLIRCTILSLSVRDVPFRSREIEILGKILGTSDLLAQMADRNYLEKLLLLFKEFEEAGIPTFDSEMDLLQKTEDFYKFVAQKRMSEEFEDISTNMLSHFKSRWNIQEDLYAASISKNIEYLKGVVAGCQDSFECYLDNLRRLGISKQFRKQPTHSS